MPRTKTHTHAGVFATDAQCGPNLVYGMAPALTATSSSWHLCAKRYIKTWALAALMGFKLTWHQAPLGTQKTVLVAKRIGLALLAVGLKA